MYLRLLKTGDGAASTLAAVDDIEIEYPPALVVLSDVGPDPAETLIGRSIGLRATATPYGLVSNRVLTAYWREHLGDLRLDKIKLLKVHKGNVPARQWAATCLAKTSSYE